MSDNKIIYSPNGASFKVKQGEAFNEVAKFTGIIDVEQESYEYLEVSGNVKILNDIHIVRGINSDDISLKDNASTEVLFNSSRKITSSPNFKWSQDTLDVTGSISASLFIKGDGSYLTNLKSSELDYNYITIGSTQALLGTTATTVIEGLSSVTSTTFIGDLEGNADTATSLQNIRTISATGDTSWNFSFDGSSDVSVTTSLSTISGLTAGTYNNSPTTVRPFSIDTKGRITSIGDSVTITPSYNNVTDIPTNLSAIAALTSGTGILKKTGASTWALEQSSYLTETELLNETYYVKIGGSKFYIGKSGDEGTSATTISAGLSSIVANSFVGDLNGTADKLDIETISTNGTKNILLSSGYGSQQIETKSTSWLSFNTSTNTLYAQKFSGDGTSITNIDVDNINNFTTEVRSKFSAGTGITISGGVIAYTGGSNAITSVVGSTGISVSTTSGTATVSVSSDVMRKNTTQTITGVNSFTSTSNNFSGTFEGNGTNITNISTSNITNLQSYVRSQFTAGTGITISGTGQISADGGSTAEPGGSYNGAIQFKNGTSFEGDPNLHWDSTNDRLGIGTSAPDHAIEIKTSTPFIKLSNTSQTEFGLHFIDNANEYTEYAKITYNAGAGNKLSFYVDNSTAILNIKDNRTVECTNDLKVGTTFFVDESARRIGINDTTPSYPLDINGITRIDDYLIVGNTSTATTAIRPGTSGNLDLGNSNYKWDDIWATNTTIQSSDERRKDLIENIPHGVEFLNSVRPVQYKWKDYTQTNDDGTQTDIKYTRKHFGIIAQELKTILEEKNISTNDFAPFVYDSDSDSYAIRYGEFVPILIKSVQELSKENNDLKTRLEILETLVSSLLK